MGPEKVLFESLCPQNDTCTSINCGIYMIMPFWVIFGFLAMTYSNYFTFEVTNALEGFKYPKGDTDDNYLFSLDSWA